jgi:ubiquinone/menaquinone biosynthesis C-methylase UbiE
MKSKLSTQKIRGYWTEQAAKYSESPEASWSDVMVIEKEINEICSRLDDGDRVLDVGCANGYSTASYARRKRVRIRGIDYVPEMISLARGRIKDEKAHFRKRIAFAVGDITALNEPSDAYDKVIVTRVVINLHDWDQQRAALHEVARVLRPGGILLLSEATLQGWGRLNKLRLEWGLPKIPMPSFNLYLDENRVIEELSTELQLIELVNFASTYYVGTRLIKPLLKVVSAAKINVADPHSEWNRWVAALPAAGDYGTQKLFVFKKSPHLRR